MEKEEEKREREEKEFLERKGIGYLFRGGMLLPRKEKEVNFKMVFSYC